MVLTPAIAFGVGVAVGIRVVVGVKDSSALLGMELDEEDEGSMLRVVATTTVDVRVTDAGLAPYWGLAMGLGAARMMLANRVERSTSVCMVGRVCENDGANSAG